MKYEECYLRIREELVKVPLFQVSTFQASCHFWLYNIACIKFYLETSIIEFVVWWVCMRKSGTTFNGEIQWPKPNCIQEGQKHLGLLAHTIAKSLDGGSKVQKAVFVEFSRAFNIIPRSQILDRLSSLEAPSWIVNQRWSIMSRANSQVSWCKIQLELGLVHSYWFCLY